MKYAIGVDLGGTAIKYGLINEVGEIIFEKVKPTRFLEKSFLEPNLIDIADFAPLEPSLDPLKTINNLEVIFRVKSCIEETIQFSKENNFPLLGLGMGIPGLVDKGWVSGCDNIPELNNTCVNEAFEKVFDMPFIVDNDANVMGLGELYFGGDKTIHEMVFLTIGTGIGGAIVNQGKLYGGYRNRGTEFGHFSIDIHGPICSCGSRGCLEIMASVPALIADYRRISDLESKSSSKKEEDLDGKILVVRYLSGEKEARIAFENHFSYLSAGLASIINILSPQKIILGGGITESGEFYIDEIRKRTLKLAMKETSEFTKIESARWGNKSGFMGAAALVFNRNN